MADTDGRRITVALSRRGADQLDQIQTRTGQSKTDVVNRALLLLGLVTEATAKGERLLLTADDTTTEIVLL